MPPELADRLLAWYARAARALPWRGAGDPYRVWVSEIMLQQTQVETVIPYYQRWLARFPTLPAVAAAPLGEVLAAWEGLGYYSRARNLHRAAQQVVREHGGRLPSDLAQLRALPGIGRYTAAAVASIAFGADAAVLDGNVKRVLARVFDFRRDVKSPAGEKALWGLAESLLPAGRAGDYNQALMDLGATVCTSRDPACAACPLAELCRARRLGVQLERPVKAARRPLPQREQVAGVVLDGRGRVLLVQRPAGGLLGGLWAFPAADLAPGEAAGKRLARLRQALRAGWGLRVRAGQPAWRLTHTFTHFHLTLYVCLCSRTGGRLARGGQPRQWVRLRDLDAFPMGKPDRQIARWLRQQLLG